MHNNEATLRRLLNLVFHFLFKEMLPSIVDYKVYVALNVLKWGRAESRRCANLR